MNRKKLFHTVPLSCSGQGGNQFNDSYRKWPSKEQRNQIVSSTFTMTLRLLVSTIGSVEYACVVVAKNGEWFIAEFISFTKYVFKCCLHSYSTSIITINIKMESEGCRSTKYTYKDTRFLTMK